MTSRERARLILNHQEADRPAIDLGATCVTGISGWTYRALKHALGIQGDRVRVFDLFQMLAEVEDDVRDALHCDFAMVPNERLKLGLTYGNWKPYAFWDGQTFEVPGDFEPEVKPDGSLEIPYEPGDCRMMRMPQGGRFFDLVPTTVNSTLDIAPLPESEWGLQEPLTDVFLERESEKARRLYESTEYAIFGEPPLAAPFGYGPLYEFALRMMTETGHCRDYLMRSAEAVAKCYEQYLQAVGEYIDVVAISRVDFGTQDREMFAPELFGEFHVPAWKMITDVVHRWPGVKTWIHCCGSVPGLVPHFIDAGVDCLNPVQWTASGMGLKTLKERYGDRLVFWGGAVSTQRTFPFGTPEDVAREVWEVLETMAPGGGYVVNPIHNILPEVPVENIVALYETARRYRYK